MKILALDIAKTTGWAIFINDKVEDGGSFRCKTLLEFHNKVLGLVDKWKPEHVITAKPNRFFDAIFSMAKQFGAAQVALDRRGLKFYTKNGTPSSRGLPMDSSMKKVVLKNGHAKKEDIMKWAGTDDEDRADAEMFCHYLNSILNEPT